LYFSLNIVRMIKSKMTSMGEMRNIKVLDGKIHGKGRDHMGGCGLYSCGSA
jgi:hypothetical protein